MSKIKFDLEIKFGSQYGKEEEEAGQARKQEVRRT